ncbi:MAG: RNA polymerase sigma factor [Acidimicrobiales bacterium]
MAEDPAPQHTDTQSAPDDGPVDLTDTILVRRVVDGDDEAFLELFRRHAFPAWRLALAVAGTTAGAVSAVAEGFTRVFARARDTDSQPISFRLAVVSATRQAAIAEAKAAGTDDSSTGAAGPGENTLLQLFRGLPERSRSVLWLVVGEGGTAAQASPLLGLSVDGTEVLLERASDTLHERYVEHERAIVSDDACQAALDQLADETLDADDPHVEACEECRRRAAAVLNLRRTLRGIVIPLPMVLGDASLAHWYAWIEENAGRRAAVLPVWAERAMGAAAAGVIGIALLGAVLLGTRTRDHGPELAAPLGEVATQGEAAALDSTSSLAGSGFTFPRGANGPIAGTSAFPAYRSGGTFGGVPFLPAPVTPAPGSAPTPTPSPTPEQPPQDSPPPAAPSTGVVADLGGAGVPVAAEVSEDCPLGLEIGELPPIGCDPSAPANGQPVDATLPPPLEDLLDPILAPLDPILCGLLGCG